LHEICRIYRVPPHMVADLERATFSNIEQMSLEFVTFTLMPWLTRWERSAERWLLTPKDRAKFFVRFNVDGLLRADTAARAEYLANQWRQVLRPQCGDNLMCRQHLAARELLEALNRGLDQPDCYALAAALSLALTDRAQEIVETLDREELGKTYAN
jgi:hypothetical protein